MYLRIRFSNICNNYSLVSNNLNGSLNPSIYNVIRPIFTAYVPLIKLEIDPLIEFEFPKE